MITAGEFCNRWVILCEPGETLVDAARRMRDEHVGCLVVVERHDGTAFPVGILTDRDIVVGPFAADGAGAGTRRVGDVMSRPLLTATERDSLVDTMRAMRSRGVRRLPVVDGRGALVGLVTFDDLVEFMSDEMHELALLVAREGRRERGELPTAPH